MGTNITMLISLDDSEQKHPTQLYVMLLVNCIVQYNQNNVNVLNFLCVHKTELFDDRSHYI